VRERISRSRVTSHSGGRVELAVYRQGDPGRPVVLLVHGYPDTHAVWDEVAASLAGRFHVVRYDVRGAGASSRPFGTAPYALEHLMADLRAVLDEVSPGRPVHLVGHDWGSIQGWEAVCTMPERFASFTSISGPCLDHVGRWMRARLARPTPHDLGLAAGQSLRSWYVSLFQTPVLPELLWRAGLVRPFGQALRLGEGVEPREGHPARTMARDAAAGVGLYRANMRERLRNPRERRTDVPTQVIVPTQDLFVSPHLVGGLGERVPDLSLRTIAARHWVPRSHPDVIARWVGEHVTRVEGGPLTAAESRALRRARVGPGRRPFEGSLVVITGAGGAVGRATALAFARQGAEVVSADPDAGAAERTAESAGRLGADVHAFGVEASDAAAMEEFAAAVTDRLGTPDVLVNASAGVPAGGAGRLVERSAQDWREVLDADLWGVVHGARLFGARMAEGGRGGHIVNIVSAAAFTPTRLLPAHATGEAAALMLTECLRGELAGRGVGVSAVCTGLPRPAGPQEAGRPEKVARQVLAAVRDDRALLPASPEARLAHLLSRLSPGAMRLLARTGRR
jgi:NAD(P)-dependent dehydrogenase (short-subunit alcohol dehydrogenase family)/pimeloyl-ACP methyl ester carboxylesterase